MLRKLGTVAACALVAASFTYDWGASSGQNTANEAKQPQTVTLTAGATTPQKERGEANGTGEQKRTPAVSNGSEDAGEGIEGNRMGAGEREGRVPAIAPAKQNAGNRHGIRTQHREVQGSDVSTSARAVSGNGNRVLLGTFKLTAYTAGYESTGKRPGHPEYGNVAISGSKRANFKTVKVKEDYTIAADWGVLPPGSVVWIDGIGRRTVEDKGGGIKGKHIDVYVPELATAQKFGVSKANVYIIKWGS